MRPIIEKLPVNEDGSFVARTYTTPHFEVPWHQHIEYELIWILAGEGRSYIGNHVGTFRTGDIFFLGSNLPHTFQKRNKELITSALVIQFKDDFWGRDFLALPECKGIRQLFNISSKGLKLGKNISNSLSPLLKKLEVSSSLLRISALCECLQLIAERKDYKRLSTQETIVFTSKKQERIDRIFRFTIEHFQEPITLETVAKEAGLSVPAFCTYFRKSTKKTYIDFLNEMRVGYASQQLIDTQKPVQEICFESGYNTLANFNKQFMKVKGQTPSGVRKEFLER